MADENYIGLKFDKPLKNEDLELYSKVAAWCNENGCMIVERDTYYEVVKIPRPPLPELNAYKEQRKVELTALHEVAENEAHILSSLGFEIDAGERANRDIAGLLVTLGEGETAQFMDYSNVPHEVTREQLEIMQKEVILNAQNLYQQKWSYRNQIDAMQLSEELSDLKFEFYPLSFYEQQ